ncbi:cancer/testis antigen 55-like [Arvicanthis niloticus]|uniref:cancer/testis antigen 55-like n=1 Tax=Arvicanthis niloticus TaxID=61156 RepID=UPI001485D69F|nr:cancer/testis antigen 55-like [Arvicanthis niloticus]
MHRLISRLHALFQRKEDPTEAREEQQRLLEDDTTLQNKQRVVTVSCSNHNWITEHVHFSADVGTDNNPLKVEQKLPAAVEEQSTDGLNEVTVDAFFNDHGEEPSETPMRVLLGCITSLVGEAGNNDQELTFSLDIACKDFQPYNGDLVEIEFSDDPDTQSRRVTLVKPLKHRHVNEVRVTKIDGRTGVLEDTIFFTLESLKLPSGYMPKADDLVNVIAVQSIQPNYFWRAVTMTPVQVL